MKSGLSRGQSFLVSKANELDNQTKADITAKRLRFMDTDIYHRSEITGKAGIHVLLDETTIRKAGTTSWNGNTLAKGVNLALEKIRFAVGSHATEVNPSKIGYTNKLSIADVALQNAEFKIKQDGKTLVSLPVARLMAEEVSSSIQTKEDTCVLEAIQLLRENSPISMEIEYPQGSTIPSDKKYHIEVRLIGTSTAPR